MNKPQAFPSNHHYNDRKEPTRNEGMSLLDYFAGQALGGYTSDNDVFASCKVIADKKGIEVKKFIAVSCYNFAEAMLKEREKHNE